MNIVMDLITARCKVPISRNQNPFAYVASVIIYRKISTGANVDFEAGVPSADLLKST